MVYRNDGALMRLASDGAPRWVGIDYGSGDETTECEVELLPDGSIRIMDVRRTPTGRKRK